MKRVLIFSRDTSWYGGVVNFIELLNKNLGDDFESVPFIIGRRKGGAGVLLRPLIPLFDVVRLAILLSSRRFDAYHINPSLDYSSLLRDGLFMLVLRLVHANNVIVSFHGWDKKAESRISNNRFLLSTFRYLFGYADQTLVLAEGFRDWLVSAAGFTPDGIQMFTTMFDDVEFASLRDNLVQEVGNVLFLSRLVREKGIYELIDAIHLLSADYPELKLIIAGNGPEEDSVRNYVMKLALESRVTFAGYVRGKDKVRVMGSAGLFVFPTYYGEGCPVSLLEAMAAGLPLITTRAGGISHIVKDPENGLLLDEVTPEEIATAMRRLLEDKTLRDAMSYKNRRDAWSCYSAPVVTRRFERLYAGISDTADANF